MQLAVSFVCLSLAQNANWWRWGAGVLWCRPFLPHFLVYVVTALFECLGKEDSVMHGFKRVVHNGAAGVVQLYGQSW